MTQDPNDPSAGWGADDPRQYSPPPLPPAGPPDYPPPGYGYPGGYPAPPQTSGKATAIMVLGIVGLVMVCFYGVGVILAIIALVMARGARREINESGGRLVGLGQVQAGVVCSWVTVGLVLALAAIGLAAGLFAVASNSG